MSETVKKVTRRSFAGRLAIAALAGCGAAGISSYMLDWLTSSMHNAARHKGIVVHHSATPPDRISFANAETIGLEHARRGMGILYKGRVYCIAYHYVILPDGTVEKGRPEDCRGAHTRSRRHNYWTGICLIGYFDDKWADPAFHRPTDAQMRSLVSLSADLMRRRGFGTKHVLPHRRINSTECPGKTFPMKEYLGLLRAAMKAGPAAAPGHV